MNSDPDTCLKSEAQSPMEKLEGRLAKLRTQASDTAKFVTDRIHTIVGAIPPTPSDDVERTPESLLDTMNGDITLISEYLIKIRDEVVRL